jgi:hypothetical protein
MIDNKTKVVLIFVLILSGINYYLYSKHMNELKDYTYELDDDIREIEDFKRSYQRLRVTLGEVRNSFKDYDNEKTHHLPNKYIIARYYNELESDIDKLEYDEQEFPNLNFLPDEEHQAMNESFQRGQNEHKLD